MSESTGWLLACKPCLILLLAFGGDQLLGDPRRWPHPVIWLGLLIRRLESILRPRVASAAGELAAGCLLAIVVVGAAYASASFLVGICYRYHALAGVLLELYILYTTIALTALRQHVLAVWRPLAAGDLNAARRALALIVSRDTGALPAADVARGVLESLAENAGDGVVAPLFYALIGGAPLALAYKAVSTLDSMIAYRNERYLYMGRFAAHLDDLANYLPARLTALFLLLAGCRRRRGAAGCWRIVLRDSRCSDSPNSGWPEAALAALLGVRLGGMSTYQGLPRQAPPINAGGAAPAPQHIVAGLQLVNRACWLFLLAGLALRCLLFV